MKRYIIPLMLAVGALSPLVAMQGGKLPIKGKAAADFKKYVDRNAFIAALADIFFPEEDTEVDSKEIAKKILNAVKLGKVPVSINKKDVLLEKLFNIELFKIFLVGILEDAAYNKLDKSTLPEHLKTLQGCLNKVGITEVFSAAEFKQLKKFIKASRKKLQGKAYNADDIDIEKAPNLFGWLMKDFFYPKILNGAIQRVLGGETLTASLLLDCIDFTHIALKAGYEPDNLPNMEGIKGFIEHYLKLMRNDKDALQRILDILANDRQLRKLRGEQEKALVANSNNQ